MPYFGKTLTKKESNAKFRLILSFFVNKALLNASLAVKSLKAYFFTKSGINTCRCISIQIIMFDLLARVPDRRKSN
jgi:hypothetical protein